MVIEFSNNYKLIKKYDGKLKFTSPQRLGTYLPPAIRSAIPMIKEYQKSNDFKNVLNIIITDGQFHGYLDTCNCLRELQRLGHHTIIITVGTRKIDKEAYPMVDHIIFLEEFSQLSDMLIRIFKLMKKELIEEVVQYG